MIMAITVRVDAVSHRLLAAVSTSVLSATLYIWLTPLLCPALSLISRPIDFFPWWVPATVKLFELVLLSTTSLSNRILFHRLTNEWRGMLHL